jgi:GT2 family glycosyltransferase
MMDDVVRAFLGIDGSRLEEFSLERQSRSSSPPLSYSIVIPSHSRADLLRLCLKSVARFSPPNTEVIVVDDGSPGGIISQTASGFSGVRVVRLPSAGGFCRAANTGIAESTGQVIELLNDDAEVTEGWATAALRWFVDERVAAVAPLILQNDPDRLQRCLQPLIDTAGDEYDPGGFAIKRGHGQVRGQESGVRSQESGVRSQESGVRGLKSLFPTSFLQRPGLVWGASAAAAFYRRDAVMRAGGFPEKFRAYFEDVDLSFRLRRLGFEIVYDPGSVVWHRVSSSYGKKPSRRVLEQQSCNEELVFWRNIGGKAGGRWLPRHAAVLLAKALKRFQEGTLIPWFLGRIRALLG